ncbi:PIN domain-containing protein [Candidatus Micrarchaeota archaeon]|nr:PIN domain-containing protein [Candidatus Micrarchaeota archaeon]
MVFLDTSFIIDFGRNKTLAVEKMQSFEASGTPLRVCTPVIFELSSGWPPGIDDKRKALLQRMQVVPFDATHAEKAGALNRHLIQQGQGIGALDAMIAAVALVEGEALVTRNKKHYERVAGLEVLDY